MEGRVKNKAPAALQISAEQILLEAYERKETPLQQTEQIADLEELAEYQGRKRQEYEGALRRNRLNTGQWMRYAQWELEQREFARARSVFERALEVNSTHVPTWIRYIQCELKEKNINHARNLLDRAVTLLPRVDKLWFTYVATEETLGNIAGCRAVFERWMHWRPPVTAWAAYVNMEKRYREFDRARGILRRYVTVHPGAPAWNKWAKFEMEAGNRDTVREVYALGIDTLVEMAHGGVDFLDESLLAGWASFETRHREYERARALYTYGLEKLPKSKSAKLYADYTAFEKQYGAKEGIENVVLTKRRSKYEDLLKEDPADYDTWFSYITLGQESGLEADQIREIFERAVSNVPPHSKRLWRRYIFLWIKYAIWEELENKEVEKAREIYKTCISIIPHKKFTFAKVWLLWAKFEIRHGNLPEARKILGRGLGMSGGKPALYKGYIALEAKLREFDRCRKLYDKYVEKFAEFAAPWMEYAELEQMLGDEERARAIFELAVSQPEMEMPELVWKRFIEFEAEEENYDRARAIYRQLLDRTHGHIKVWISFAQFEVTVPAEDQELQYNDEGEAEIEVTEEAKARARIIFGEAWDALKAANKREERVVLFESWREFEEEHGDDKSKADLDKRKPTPVKKKRKLEDGTFEEYIDYVFPTDEEDKSFSKLLENARKWKLQNQS
ncbi:YALIA101S02e04214g1_1 [Yarrowia lipolytica]|nr:Pre-mRNA-splicing factor CLF1 [Yarrowia lipolytica]SEI31880.1 YALIA101S02e04214g1_1 [Yarrowia lipolytica]